MMREDLARRRPSPAHWGQLADWSEDEEMAEDEILEKKKAHKASYPEREAMEAMEAEQRRLEEMEMESDDGSGDAVVRRILVGQAMPRPLWNYINKFLNPSVALVDRLTLSHKVDSLTDENKQLSERAAAVTRENDQLKDQIKALHGDKIQLKEQYTTEKSQLEQQYNQHLAQLEEQYNKKQTNSRDESCQTDPDPMEIEYQQEVAFYQNQADEFNHECDARYHQHKEALAENERLQKQQRDAAEDNEWLTNHFHQLTQAKQQLADENQRLNDQRLAFEEEYERICKTSRMYHDDAEALRQALMSNNNNNRNQDMVEQLKEKVTKVKGERDQLIEAFEYYQNLLLKAQAQNKDLLAENRKLRRSSNPIDQYAAPMATMAPETGPEDVPQQVEPIPLNFDDFPNEEEGIEYSDEEDDKPLPPTATRADASPERPADELEQQILDDNLQRFRTVTIEGEQVTDPTQITEPTTAKVLAKFTGPLTQEWEDKVQATIEIRKMTEIVAKATNRVELRRSDFATIIAPEGYNTGAPTGWLNDEIVNAWFSNLVDALNKKAGYDKSNNGGAPYGCLTTAWYTNVTQHGMDKISRWARRAKFGGESLLNTEACFLPINTGSHWVVLCISGKNRTIAHYDSLDSIPSSSKSDRFVGLAFEWLEMELKDLFKEEEWNVIKASSGIQDNSSDCGVFTCLNGLAFALGFEQPNEQFGAQNMNHARRALIALLMNGEFAGDFAL
ncbi:hypothetical protein BDV97DRAFT_358510 [Delphinella strobiligena]|nr:hypothetical protein BDV97DRAFT_358510 [Delphinella strobiligena]